MPTTVGVVRESRRVARSWKPILAVVLGSVVALGALTCYNYREVFLEAP